MGERLRGVSVLAAAIVAAVAVSGCGGEDCCTMTPVDAAVDASVSVDAPPPPSNSGFTRPTAPLAAWSSPRPDTYVAETLDLSCLDTPRADLATTTSVALDVTVRDFQSGNLLASAQVAVFHDSDHASPFAMATTNASGVASLTIPSDTKRVGFAITASNARPTYVLDRILAPTTSTQTLALASVSSSTAATLPALVGVTTIPDRALQLGTVRDCQGNMLSGFIATVSSMPGMPAHLPGAVTYYFSDSVGLPVRHTAAAAGTRNGMFMILDVPAVPTAYVQVWGYRDATELASDTLRLIAELAVPVPANAVLVTEHDPRRTTQ